MSGYKIIGLADNEKNKNYKIIGKSELNNTNNKDKNLGEYLDNLPEEKSFLSKLPKNILIGLTHAGRNIHNLPHDIVKQFETVGKDFGSIFDSLPGEKIKNSKLLSEYLPYDNQDYSNTFGLNENSKTFVDKILQGGIEHAPELIGIGSIAKAGLRKFPITQKGAAYKLKKAENLLNNREFKKIQLNPETVNESIPFLPKTHATREMIKSIETGDYNPLFSLQSQIGKHERDLKNSPLAAERLLAPQARELKQKILQEMETGLRNLGHNDIADLMRGGLNDYHKYIKFRDEVKPLLKKIGIPTSALAVLGMGIKYGKKAASTLSD